MSDSSSAPPASNDPDTCEPPEFEPARLRARHDGWTPERQADFIQALAESACVADACRAVGMSERSAYSLRARPDAISFRNAWDAALDFSIRRLFDAVLSRAINGVAVPVFYQGEQVGERRRYDERLAMFLLRYRDPVRYGKWNDSCEFRGHPESHAIALASAKIGVRTDADCSGEDLPEGMGARLREIAARFLRTERQERQWARNRDDVP